jgi:hypothetical protein
MTTPPEVNFGEKFPPPGPGCSNRQTGSSSAFGASVSGSGMGFSASASIGTSSLNKQEDQVCNPDFKQDQLTNNKYTRSTSIDNSKFIMTKNSMKAISESTNQMIVNSITKTTSSATQNVDLLQKMAIKIKGCAGNLTIRGVKQTMNVDMSNVASMTMSAIDNVRTDLANGVLTTLKNNISDETLNKMQQDINSQIKQQQSSDTTQKATSVSETEQKTQLPMANVPGAVPANISANVNIKQKVSNDLVD